MEIRNLLDAVFKTLFVRMLKELSEDLGSIKMTQSEKKGTLTEIKNNLQGNNSTVDEAENQINQCLQHKEAKNDQSEQEEKKNPKKAGLSKETLQLEGLGRHIESHEKQRPTARIALPSEAIIQNQRADKELPRQEKAKGVYHHQTIII